MNMTFIFLVKVLAREFFNETTTILYSLAKLFIPNTTKILEVSDFVCSGEDTWSFTTS